jgi:DnaJ-class molecular chaperone
VKTCPNCNGDGVIEKGTDDEQQCPTCGGSGFVPDDAEDEEVTRTAKWTTDVGFTPKDGVIGLRSCG